MGEKKITHILKPGLPLETLAFLYLSTARPHLGLPWPLYWVSQEPQLAISCALRGKALISFPSKEKLVPLASQIQLMWTLLEWPQHPRQTWASSILLPKVLRKPRLQQTLCHILAIPLRSHFPPWMLQQNSESESRMSGLHLCGAGQLLSYR